MTEPPANQPDAPLAGPGAPLDRPMDPAAATPDPPPAAGPADPSQAGAFAAVPDVAPAPDPGPAPAAPAPAKEEDEGEDIFAVLGAWVRQHPLFALLLVFISCGGPYVLWAWRANAARARLSEQQDAWQERLSGHGLPVPWVPQAQVPAPPQVDAPGAALDPLGLGARQRALVAWQALLMGNPVSPDKLHVAAGTSRGGEDLLAAVRACALLREAAARPGSTGLLAQVRADAELAPAALRRPLRLAADLIDGRLDVVADCERLLREDPPPAARGALLAVRDEARRRRAAQVLEAPSADGLRELAQLAREGLDLVAAVDSRAEVLAGSMRHLDDADALVELFEAAAPQGVAGRPALQRAWGLARPAVEVQVAERLRRFEDDPAPAFATIARAGRVDPTFDAPADGFLGWREHLQRVVNDEPQLERFAERFFELGFVPAGLDDVLAARRALFDGGAVRESSTGALVGHAVVKVALLRDLRAHGGVGASAIDSAAQVVQSSAALLDERLGPRQDAVARRLRAQLAFLRGCLRSELADQPSSAGSLEHLARARELGHEPLHRLLEEVAATHRALKALGPAIEAARERVEVGDALAKRLAAGLTPSEVVHWELRGWPVDPLTMGGERVSARLDLAALLAGEQELDDAITLAAEAATLHPDHAARAHLARADLLLAQRRTDDAREALRAGLRTVLPHERALRERLQERLDALPPG